MSIGDRDAGGTRRSYQARHEKQRLLFFVESSIQSHRWHCHEAARAEADLSVLSIPPRIGSGGSDGGPQRKIWEEKSVLFRSVELTCVALGTWYLPNFGPVHQKAGKPKRDLAS